MKRKTMLIAALLPLLTAQAAEKKATICTTYGDDIYDYQLDQMIDSVVPPSAKRLIVLTQCYGGDAADNFTGTNTAVISATSPGQKAIYGGYDDDAANACKPGAGKTGQTVHDAGTAGKDSTETPVTGGGLAPGAVSLEPVTADGAVRSRHVIVYAGMPDKKGRDNAQRDKIKANFAGQPNTTVKTVGGEGPEDGWDKHGWKRGLQEAINEAAAAIEAAPDPSKEQFLLFVTDHGDLHEVEHVTTPAPPSNSVVVANVAAFVAADFAERVFERPGFSITVDIAPSTHEVGDPAAYTPFFPTNAWRLRLTPPPPAAPLVLTAFEERFIEWDDGVIGNAPEEGVRLFFPADPALFVDSFFDITYDVEIFNDTPEPYLIMDFSQDTGPVAKGESEPGFTLITESMLIDENDMALEGHAVVVNGCTLTVNGVHVLESLILTNNATATHSAGSLGMSLTVLDDVRVLPGSKIDVSSKGLLPLPACTGRSGGSHGGRGANYMGESAPTYGDPFRPTDLGSGGSSEKAALTRGGGRVQIRAGELLLNGDLHANGQTGGGDYTSGGSGGGILLEVGTLSGGGSLQANGGNPFNTGSQGGGSGGGGRIAIYYEEDTAFAPQRIEAAGGTRNGVGGAGTIYVQCVGAGDALIVDNLGAWASELSPTPFECVGGRPVNVTLIGGARAEMTATQETVFTSVTLSNATATVAGELAGPELNVTLRGDALISHHAGDSNGVMIAAQTLDVGSGAAIDVSGKGMLPLWACTGRSGGSYGGRGYHYFGESAPTYGDAFLPTELGSGGISERAAHTRGGGRIQITAGTLTLNGALRANGQNGGGDYSAGGSGGSILIAADTLAGGGSLQANGGSPFSTGSQGGGGGGGGRVAVYCSDGSGFDPERIEAGNGYPNYTGGAGSVYLKSGAAEGALVFDNLDRSTAESLATPFICDTDRFAHVFVQRNARVDLTVMPGMAFSSVMISNAVATVSGLVTGPALSVALRGNSVLSHPPGDAGGVQITAAFVDVGAGSAVDVNGKGMPPLPACTGRSGGSYGGRGQNAYGESAPTYGDAFWPSDLGSGGTGDGTTRGGGRIQIAADLMTLDGALRANGNDGWYRLAGGSGGSVLLSVGVLSGSGAIQANGGVNGSESGAGGGGRVAVYAQSTEGFSPSALEAKSGGPAAQWGTAFMGVPRTVAVTCTDQGVCDPAGPVVIPYGGMAPFVFNPMPVSLSTNGMAVPPDMIFEWVNNGLWRGTLADAVWLEKLNGCETLDAAFETLTAGQAVAQPGGGLAVTVNGLAGWRYTLERRESLTEGEWLPVAGQIEILCGATGPLVLTDAAVLPKAFYRVVARP